MELTKELIDANGFTDEQVQVIKEHGSNYIVEIKKQFDDEYKATANTNAQNIIGSAASGVEKLTGFRPREAGEHLEVYNKLAFDHFNKSAVEELNKSKLSYEDKLKNFKGSEDIHKSLEELRSKYDSLQAKEAEFEALASSGIKEKYETLLEENKRTNIDNAFVSVLPTFPTDVNEYEKVGKWNEFKSEVLKTNDIVKVDNEYYAIDKTNPHKQVKLSELVSKDGNIQKLLEGRNQQGLNAKQDFRKVDGVPFDVPKGAGSKERAELIRDHLKKEGIDVTDKNYSTKFSELNSKILLAN